MSTACSPRYFSASLMHPVCLNSILFEPGVTSISLSKRASPGLSSTRRSVWVDFLPIFAHRGWLGGGNVTVLSQKSLVLFTRQLNASSCTGLVR